MKECTSMKDYLNPTEEEVRKWAYADEYQPTEDWDLMLLHSDLLETVFELAGDEQCPRKRFFLNVLYILSYDQHRSSGKIIRTDLYVSFVKRAEASADDQLKQWAERTKALWAGTLKPIYGEWCNYGFLRQDL